MLDHLPSLADAFACVELSIEKLKAMYHRASRGYRDALMDLDGVLAEDAMLLGDNSFKRTGPASDAVRAGCSRRR